MAIVSLEHIFLLCLTVFKYMCAVSAGAEVNCLCPFSSLPACYRRAVSKGRKVSASVQSVRFSRLWYTRPPPHSICQIKLPGAIPVQ